jgi:hypothetical protein
MTTYISEVLRAEVIDRASGRCEYCRVHQEDRLFAHEIDHIIAEKHGGRGDSDNLGLACAECNRYKSSDLCSLDAETQTIVPLFYPRQQRWADHFRSADGVIEGLTPTGRVTARLLQFNRLDTMERRRALARLGRWTAE